MDKLTKFGLVGIVVLIAVTLFSQPSQSSELEQTPITTQSKDYGTVRLVDKSDWTLSIPDIDFEQQMTKITKQGKTLPVPDGRPGYYTEHEGNLFIVGHNGSVFNRLDELPSKIYIYQNNSPNEYSLVDSETTLVENINMDSLLTHQGVVIMTCAGDKIGDTYTHRLILYYKP